MIGDDADNAHIRTYMCTNMHIMRMVIPNCCPTNQYNGPAKSKLQLHQNSLPTVAIAPNGACYRTNKSMHQRTPDMVTCSNVKHESEIACCQC